MDIDAGLPVASDDRFTARMRLHQSWWRSAILGLLAGTGPTQDSARVLGNMLRPEDGEAGANYLTDQIHALAVERAAGSGVDAFRCHHNLLSSQPMCFNLFGPLCGEKPNAALVDALVAETVDQVLPTTRIEWEAGGLLGDKTSFDAFIGYRTSDGARRFLGIETKLTEPFSQSDEDPSRYAEAFDRYRSTWASGVTLERVANKRWFQLFRNHLLVQALADQGAEDHGQGRVAVVYYPVDTLAVGAVQEYRNLLAEPEQSFVDLRLDRLLGRWASVVANAEEVRWHHDLVVRYLALGLSVEAWERAVG